MPYRTRAHSLALAASFLLGGLLTFLLLGPGDSFRENMPIRRTDAAASPPSSGGPAALRSSAPAVLLSPSSRQTLSDAQLLVGSHRIEDQQAFLRLLEAVPPREWLSFVRSLQPELTTTSPALRFFQAAILSRSYSLAPELDLVAYFRFAEADDTWHFEGLLASLSPESALPLLLELKDFANARSLFQNLLTRLAETNPDAAVTTFLRHRMHFGGDWRPLVRVLQTIAASHPEKALALYYQHLPTAQQERLTGTFFSDSFGNSSYADRLALTRAIPNQADQRRARSAIVNHWARQDAPGALQFLSSLPNGAEKNRLISNVAWSLSQDAEPAALVDWAIEHTHGSTRSSLISQTFTQLARTDPTQATALLDAIPFGDSYSSALRSLAREWSKRDAPAALEWALALPPGQESAQVTRTVIENYARENPQEALRHIFTHFSDNPTEHLIAVGRVLGREDPAAALLSIRDLPDDAHYESALRGVLSGWTAEDPEAAVAMIEAENLYEVVGGDVGSIANRWANFAPVEAAAWASGLEDPALRTNAIRNIASTWVRQDTLAASAWIAQLPRDNDRDHIIPNLIQNIQTSDPEAAFAWALEISNSAGRVSRARQSLKHLTDPAKARELITGSGLPPEEQRDLISQLELTP